MNQTVNQPNLHNPRLEKDHFRVLEEKALEECIPLRAVLELTDRCNLRCVHCYMVRREGERELVTEEVMDILDQLASAGCLYLTLTGGEVLLRSDFFEIASYAREKRFALRLFTNGTLVDESAADRIAELAPISVEVSIYGASRETYGIVTRSPAGFDAVMAGLELLSGKGLRIVLKFPVMRENVGDLSRVREIAGVLGVRLVEEPRLTPRDDGDPSPMAHHLSDCQMHEFFGAREGLREALEELPRRRPDDYICTTARTGPVIGPYGDLYACVQMKGMSVGNLRNDAFSRLWADSPFLLKLRSLRFRDFAECSRCERVRFCFWCPGRALLEDGGLTRRSSYACRIAGLLLEEEA